MKSTVHNIIIVGGGLNGLGCAKQLHATGKRFKIITENIGGRVKTSPDGHVNYGAYFVTADCHHVMPYIDKGSLVHFAKAHFHRDHRHYHAYSWRMLKHALPLIKLLRELLTFRRHVQRLRQQATRRSYRELIEADPYLRKFYHQPAGEFIKTKGLEKLTKEYLEQFLWAAYFTDPRHVSTAIFLAVLLTMIVPSYTFKFNFAKLIKPFKKNIIIDTVISIQKRDGQYELRTQAGQTYYCKILVLATPMNITNQLIKSRKIKGGINVNYYHLRGQPKKEYNHAWYSFFPIEEQTAISRETDGSYLYFYSGQDKLAKYFDSWTVITKDSWQPALFFLGDDYIDEQPEPNLYLATDHNVAGMEDAFINGQYIAHLILKHGNPRRRVL